ncbi:MAG: hypothetical protein JSR11_03645 [Bacteroidetes bacterium]|nr:hypothetical protein [Bacteroidota bacterium]
MKTVKGILSLLTAATLAVLLATGIASFVAPNSSQAILMIALPILAFYVYAGASQKFKNLIGDGVYTEIWLGELVKRFRFKREWLNRIPRYDNVVKNKVIHLVDVGADPQVFLDLVIDNNNPVPTSTRTDQDIPISLNRYDTENTRVSLTELQAISYDKMAVTLDLHMNAISDKAAKRAAWNLAATNDSYVKTTSGATDNRAVEKKRITPDDLVMMSEITGTTYDQGGPDWPEGEGIAVLDIRHIADLQKLDERFDKQWKDARTGELFPYNGWQILKFNNNAMYTADGDGTFTRKAFGAAYDPVNDLHSSLFFLPQRAFAAADASPEMFYRMASIDPELRSNTVGFRHWNIVAKKKVDGFYQLISPKI